MKRSFAIPALLVCLGFLACPAGFAEDKPQPGVSKHDQQVADQEYKRALELKKAGQIEDALLAATHAAQLAPANSEFMLTREMLRQQIVSGFLDKGNRLAEAGDKAGAATQFGEALTRDPENSYIQQRLRDVAPSDDPERQRVMELLAGVNNLDLSPFPGKKNIHAGLDTRSVWVQIGQQFGINFTFDPSFVSRPIRIDLDSVDFYTVTSFVGRITKTFWAPISSKDAMVAPDTQEMRNAYERMAVRTFYVGNAVAPTDVNDLANLMRTIFDAKFLTVEASRNTITVRAPRQNIAAMASFMDSIMDAKPEILLEIQEFEFDSDKLRQYGLNLPTDFQVFNVPSEIRRVLGSGAQAVIDQLNQNGVIDPSKISPSDLTNLQNSPLLLPFVFFGKGLGLTGIVVPGISGKLSSNISNVVNMEHMTVRAMDGEAATFRIGTKFPVVSSNFTAVTLNSRGQVEAGETPQFQYVDLGVSLKATPHYQSGGTVKLDFELEVQGLGTLSFNNVPDITNRSFKGNITVREGEPSVVGGLMTDSELRSTQGYPGLGQIPVLKGVINNNSSDRAHNEILIVITPHVIRKPFHDKGASALWTLN